MPIDAVGPHAAVEVGRGEVAVLLENRALDLLLRRQRVAPSVIDAPLVAVLTDCFEALSNAGRVPIA